MKEFSDQEYERARKKYESSNANYQNFLAQLKKQNEEVTENIEKLESKLKNGWQRSVIF